MIKPRASLYTVGCRLNQAETAIFSNQLKTTGYDIVPFGKSTDLFILNTCSVTHGAETDCRRAIRRTLQHSPNAFIAITGCYAQTGAATLAGIPGVDLIVGSEHKMQLLKFVTSLRKQKVPQTFLGNPSREDFLLEGAGDFETTRATLKVQDGCDFMCSFCNIPFARGRERSRQMSDLLREAQLLAKRGHKEIVLSGVNIARYNSEDYSLLDVIINLEKVSGIHRIRISSIEPTTISEKLLNHMAASHILCSYLHIPLQSGNDNVLQRMRRRYSSRDYIDFIKKATEIVPNVTLGTDVMVGFPGETALEFQDTLDTLRQLPFSYFHVFSYSERQGTAAQKLDSKLHPSIIHERSKILRDLSQFKQIAASHKQTGKIVSVLFEERDKEGYWSGLTDTYIRVKVRTDDNIKNTISNVKIIGIIGRTALGELLTHDNHQKVLPVLA